MKDVEKEVYKYIKKNKPEKQAEIVRDLGLLASVVHHAIYALQLMGKVKKPRYEVIE